jgi:formate dehydrogenase subunit gamma
MKRPATAETGRPTDNRRGRGAILALWTTALLVILSMLTGVFSPWDPPRAWAQETEVQDPAIKGEINPRAEFWRAVRRGASGYTAVAGEDRGVLIRNGGENWRVIRNGLVSTITPWLLAGVLLAIGLFYIIVGQDKLEEPPTGPYLKRWALWERILHWVTAALFIIMALTGLTTLFGRAVLIPVFGLSGFSVFAQWSLWIHNYTGPLFIAGMLIELVVWFRINIPRWRDVVWFKNLGGMVGSGPRPHAGRINGGEKAWFWLLFFCGIGLAVTGVILDFPIWGQDRITMQVSNIIHSVLGLGLLAASFGHIYIGTIGAEGTFRGMWRGDVSAQWAKQHQDLWYEKRMRERRGVDPDLGTVAS